MTTLISFDLPKKLVAQLDALTTASGRTSASVVEEALGLGITQARTGAKLFEGLPSLDGRETLVAYQIAASPLLLGCIQALASLGDVEALLRFLLASWMTRHGDFLLKYHRMNDWYLEQATEWGKR